MQLKFAKEINNEMSNLSWFITGLNH